MSRASLAVAVGVLVLFFFSSLGGGTAAASAGAAAAGQSDVDRYELDRARKLQRDRTLRTLSDGVLRMRKLTYRSRVGDLDIPFYLFEPLAPRGRGGHPALIWIHGGVHGDFDPSYFPFIKEAVERGYVVLAPEYRGSTGYGRRHHEAIDYGGFEVDDCLTALDLSAGAAARRRGPYRRHRVESRRIHRASLRLPGPDVVQGGGGARPGHEPGLPPFPTRVPATPATSSSNRASAAPCTRAGTSTSSARPSITSSGSGRRSSCTWRTTTGTSTSSRTQQLVHALEYLKPDLAETRIYRDPPVDEFGGGHRFNRRVDRENGYRRVDSPHQRDSWNRIWTFLEWHLRPYRTTPRPW